jgi:KDO2-lipid IV(A) lauroyltransferase
MSRLLIKKGALARRIERVAVLQRGVWAAEAALFGAVLGLSGLLSADRASEAGRRLARTIGPRLDKSRVFRRNLRLAFPDQSEAQIEAMVREAWGNLGAVLAEYAHLPTICGPEAQDRIQMVVDPSVEAFGRERKRAAVYVAAHLANWEVLATTAVRLGVSLTVVYTPLRNPLLDRRLRRVREALGCDLVSRDAGSREIMRHLKRGGGIGLLVDQRMDSGEPLPFFGMDKWTTLAPARLALRFGCELIPVQIERLEGARFRVTFHAPVTPDDESAPDQDKALQMMARVNTLFEAWIRERPGDWLCSKRRWPKDAVPLARGPAGVAQPPGPARH